jgi:hypothetical protein
LVPSRGSRKDSRGVASLVLAMITIVAILLSTFPTFDIAGRTHRKAFANTCLLASPQLRGIQQH